MDIVVAPQRSSARRSGIAGAGAMGGIGAEAVAKGSTRR